MHSCNQNLHENTEYNYYSRRSLRPFMLILFQWPEFLNFIKIIYCLHF